MITYPLGVSGQAIVLTPAVLRRFEVHRQLCWWSREAGGQLFARLLPSTVVIEEATGPRPTDRRSPFSYRPDRRGEQAEIDDAHRRGLHFVGDWHTHPQPRPTPSGRDVRNIADIVLRSSHPFAGLVLVIVGQDPAPHGLLVAVSEGERLLVLGPAGAQRRTIARLDVSGPEAVGNQPD